MTTSMGGDEKKTWRGAEVCPITARSWMVATSEKKVSIVAILFDIVCQI